METNYHEKIAFQAFDKIYNNHNILQDISMIGVINNAFLQDTVFERTCDKCCIKNGF
jgi:hypothetical protein